MSCKKLTEKIAALRTADYFKERASRADMKRFRRILGRASDEPPRKGDELPD